MSILERGVGAGIPGLATSLHSHPNRGPLPENLQGTQRKGQGGGGEEKDGEERGRESAGALSFPVLHHKPTKQHSEFLKSTFKLR